MVKLKTALALLMVHLVGALPMWAARALGRAIASAGFWLNTPMTKITRTNLSQCLPLLSPQEHTQLVKQSLQSTGMLAAEICKLFSKETPLEHYLVDSEGLDVAQQALEEGKGLVILAPHLGNWEILGMQLTRLAPVTNLYQPPRLAGLDTLIRKARQRTGATLVPTSAKGVSALLKALKSGGICGILPDQNPNERKSGDFAPFFGHSAFTMVLVHKLIKKTGAKAVFAFAKRVPKGFILTYREAPAGIYSEDQDESLRALNEGVQNLVLEAPEQYQWEYKRFKVQPEGVANFYS